MASETELAITVRAIVDDAIVKLGKVKGEVGSLGNVATQTTRSLNDHKKSVDGLAGALNSLGTHYRATGQAAELLGVGAQGAVGKVGALIDVIESMSTKIPAFLAISAAIVAIASSFNFLRGSADDAGKLEDEMAKLGATVRDQGGDWKVLSKSFMDWAELQEKTTTFSKGDVIAGVKDLTAAGMSLSDAMKVTRIAEDASAATGKSLSEVNHGLMEATHGRTQALTALGIGTRKSIHDGMDFHQVLQAIEKQMGGAAAASAETYAGRMKQLGNAFTDLKEDVGNAILPLLTSIVQGVKTFVEDLRTSFEQSIAAVRHWSDQHRVFVAAVGGFLQGLVDTARLLLGVLAAAFQTAFAVIAGIVSIAIDTLTGNWGQLGKDLDSIQSAWLHALQTDFGNFGSNVVIIFENIKKNVSTIWSGLGTLLTADLSSDAGRKAAAGALGKIGGGMTGDLSAGTKPFSAGWSMPHLGNLANPFTDADGQVGGRAGGHGGRAGGRAGHGTHGTGASVHDETAKDMAATLKAWIANLTGQISTNDAAGNKSVAGLEAQKEAVRHGLAMSKADGTATPASEKAAAERTAQIDASIAEIKEETAARDLVTTKMKDQLEQTATSHREVVTAEKALEQSQIALTHANNLVAETSAKATVQTESFGQGLAKILASKIPGLTATDKPGGGVQIGFSWVQMLLSAVQNTKAFADIMKVVSEIMRVVAQIFDALRPVIDLFLKGVILIANGFITLWNVIAKLLRLLGIHVQLLDRINSDFNDISASPFIQIAHDIPTLNELASGNVSPLYPANSGHDTILNNMTKPITDGLADPGLGGGLLGGIMEVVAAVAGLSMLMKITGLGGGGGIAGVVEGLFGKGKSAISSIEGILGKTVGATTIGGALLAAAGGGLIGAGIGSLMGGGTHDIFGGLGGSAGGGIGMILGGPLGALAGSLLGGIVGGLFGHKGPNAHDNPDSMASGYGQNLADLQGSGVYDGKEAMNANGSSYTESGAMSGALGGKGMIQYIADYIASSGGAGLTDAEKKTFANEDVKDTIVGGKNGTLDLANGTAIYWSDLLSQAQDAITKIGATFSNMATSASGNLLSMAGNITRFVDGSINDLAGPLTEKPGASTQPIAQRNADGGGGTAPPITVNINGPVNGYNDVQQLGKDLEDARQRAAKAYQYGFQRVAGGVA